MSESSSPSATEQDAPPRRIFLTIKDLNGVTRIELPPELLCPPAKVPFYRIVKASTPTPQEEESP